MKKFISLIIAAAVCLSLCGCGGSDFDENLAFANLRQYISESFSSEDFYIQISKTQSEAQTVTEVSKLGEDCAFLEYDVMRKLKYFRNGKLINVSPDTFYQEEITDADWNNFTYQKTAENYYSVLSQLCELDYSNEEDSPLLNITAEKNESENYPYKVSAHLDLNKINAGELFGSGGNFGSLSIKFVSGEDGSSFDDITLHVQYDYNSEIYVILARFGEPKVPDENDGNGQRPEDIEAVYEEYLENLQTSFEQYLESMQQSAT
ncbi:MAG: lipoprotein [Porcipelethomonas sp.]